MKLVSAGIPTVAKFQVSLLSRVGWVGGRVGGVKLKLKLNSAQLKLELGLSLAIILIILKALEICPRVQKLWI